jgi:hypothetical protein
MFAPCSPGGVERAALPLEHSRSLPQPRTTQGPRIMAGLANVGMTSSVFTRSPLVLASPTPMQPDPTETFHCYRRA